MQFKTCTVFKVAQNNDKKLYERIAVLETTVTHLSEKVDVLIDCVNRMAEKQNSLEKITESLNSRWGFAMLIVSSIGASILAFKDWILIKLGFIPHG